MCNVVITVNYSTVYAGEVWERARSLQEKMQANLQMAKDRLDVLGTMFP